jgi:hypothetical protein
MAEVFSGFRGTNQIDLDIYGFDPAGPNGNLNAVRHFDRTNELRQEIIDARLWAGLHYHFSSVAGVVLGRNVANYALRHAFQPEHQLVKRLGSGRAHRRAPRAAARLEAEVDAGLYRAAHQQ